MTGELVNLRRARKARARAAAEAKAEANRIRHGLPKAERSRLSSEARLERARHDGHRRTPEEAE